MSSCGEQVPVDFQPNMFDRDVTSALASLILKQEILKQYVSVMSTAVCDAVSFYIRFLYR